MSGTRRVPGMAHCAPRHGRRAGEGRQKGTGQFFKRRSRNPGFRSTGFRAGPWLEVIERVTSACSAPPPQQVDHKDGCRYQNDNARALMGKLPAGAPDLLIDGLRTMDEGMGGPAAWIVRGAGALEVAAIL